MIQVDTSNVNLSDFQRHIESFDIRAIIYIISWQ